MPPPLPEPEIEMESAPEARPIAWDALGADGEPPIDIPPIEPVPASASYRRALGFVSLLAVCLPVLYAGAIAAVIWLCLRWLEGMAAEVSDPGGYLVLVVPVVVCGTVVFLMVKPFFARRPRELRPRPLAPEEAPALFRLVSAVCGAVGAPRSREVCVDLEVNASASIAGGLRTRLFDTHPCERDRLGNVAREAAPDVYTDESPAIDLFPDFAGLSREVTLRYYREVCELPVRAGGLVAAGALASEAQGRIEDGEALRRFAQGLVTVETPLTAGDDGEVPAGPEARLRLLRVLREHLRETAAEARPLARKVAGLEESRLRTRLRLSLDLLDREAPPETARGEGGDEEAEVAKMLSAAAVLDRLGPAFRLLTDVSAPLLALVRSVPGNRDHGPLFGRIGVFAGVVAQRLAEIVRLCGDERYPFRHARAETTLARHLVEEVPGGEDPVEALAAARTAWERFQVVRARVSGRLAALAERAEERAGLPPLPAPPEEDG